MENIDENNESSKFLTPRSKIIGPHIRPRVLLLVYLPRASLIKFDFSSYQKIKVRFEIVSQILIIFVKYPD